MRSTLQEGQKVLTPEGEGTVVEIVSDQVTVKFSSGDEKKYAEDELIDDSDPG